MKIGTLCVPDSSYYSPPDRKKPTSAYNMTEPTANSRQNVSGSSPSPVEQYQELSGNRQQMLQDLGLHYIDTNNCSWKDFRELCNQVLERTEYDAVPLEDLNISIEDEDAEMDCLNYLRKWSEDEADRGNMVAYHMGKQLSGAIANYLIDIQGKTEYLEPDGKQIAVRIMEDNTFLKSPHLGSACAIGENGKLVSFDARYADDSTREEPIIEIRNYDEEGNSLGQVYRVVLSQVDPRNATQLEIFALCVHRDKQGLGNPQDRYGDSSYLFGKSLGIFQEVSAHDFTEVKRDWIQAFSDKIQEIRTLLETATLEQLAQKYAIGNFELTGKEWEKLLDQLEKHLSQIELPETEKEPADQDPEKNPVAEENEGE